MESQETEKSRYQDKFYSQEVKLKEGIDLQELLDGKGTTFSVQEEQLDADLTNEIRKINNWDSSDIASVGIDSNAHEGGPFKGIEPLFTETIIETQGQRIIKHVVRQGSGPLIPDRALVKIHYSSYVEGHDETIDSTRLRGRPHNFILGDGVNIPAIDMAVATMKKNEKSRFLADHEFCYGKMGVPPRIPMKARLLFDIEVLMYIDDNKINEYDALSPDDRKDISLNDTLKLAAICREKGNENFKKNPKTAYNNYLKGYKILQGYSAANSEEEAHLQSEKIKILLNLAQSCLEHGKTVDCRRYIKEAIEYLKNEDLKNQFKLGKAHYIIYKSWMKDNKLVDAKKALEEAVRYVPDDTTIREAFVKLEEVQARENAIEMDTMKSVGQKLGWRN